MLLRFGIALALGALIGWERELIGKEAGVRTSMLVSAGASIFAMTALVLPYIVAVSPENLPEVVARNSGFLAVIANIVVGIGFLGAGIIFKDRERVHGLTTAAVVWATAALGTLCGIGLWEFAVISGVLMTFLLFVLRKVKFHRIPEHE